MKCPALKKTFALCPWLARRDLRNLEIWVRIRGHRRNRRRNTPFRFWGGTGERQRERIGSLRPGARNRLSVSTQLAFILAAYHVQRQGDERTINPNFVDGQRVATLVDAIENRFVAASISLGDLGHDAQILTRVSVPCQVPSKPCASAGVAAWAGAGAACGVAATGVCALTRFAPINPRRIAINAANPSARLSKVVLFP
jgi:hypothetical protein